MEDKGLEELDIDDTVREVVCGEDPDNGESVSRCTPVSEGQTTPMNMVMEDQIGMQFQSPTLTNETVGTVVGSNNVRISASIEPPVVGMVFKTWQDVESYYKEYAEQVGFGVTRAQGVYSKGDGRDRITTTWRCECWGRPDMRARREAKKRAKAMDVSGSGGAVGGVVCVDELSQRKRKSKKCECNAKIYAGLNHEGEWVLKKVVLNHDNHTPTPGMSKLVKEYRMKSFSNRDRKRALNFYEEGVPMSQIHGCLAAEVDGQENVEYTVKDLAHEVYKERRMKMVGGDTSAMMSNFLKFTDMNVNFFQAHRVDEEGRLRDILWVDARSRAAYEEFGDVVCFDATYLTNDYKLPFVNFVGVNHHGQSILLGCGLISHEDCDTFNWLFKEWLSCMNYLAPKAILTDQAAAMRKPIEEVMPQSRHRWCIWHIMRKIPEKLGKCERYGEFKGLLKAIVYESLNVEEFESHWNAFIAKYNLGSNEWLASLYNERHMWIPAYMKEYFWAGMKTTQRVESINSFFDGFVNRNTKLFEFPLKYAKAMDKRIRDEMAADANCAKYVRRLVTGFTAEKVFQKLYTDTKFQEIQSECVKLMYCYCSEVKPLNENTFQYVLEDRVWVVPEGQSEEVVTNRRRFYSAMYDNTTTEVICECRKFVTDGIMCRHMMRILDQNRVVEIPDKYILNRWRKDVPRKHTAIRVSYHDPSKSVAARRYNKLMIDFESLCEEAAALDDAAVEIVSLGLAKLKSQLDQCRGDTVQESVDMSYPGEAIQSSSFRNVNGNTMSSARRPSEQHDRNCDLDNGLSDVPIRGSDVPVIKDPVLNKRPRGRPKGSRNKTLAELLFKKPYSKTKKSTEHNDNKATGSSKKVKKKKGKCATKKANYVNKGSKKGSKTRIVVPKKKVNCTNNTGKSDNTKGKAATKSNKGTKKGKVVENNAITGTINCKKGSNKGKAVQLKIGKELFFNDSADEFKITENIPTDTQLIVTSSTCKYKVPKVKLLNQLEPQPVATKVRKNFKRKDDTQLQKPGARKATKVKH